MSKFFKKNKTIISFNIYMLIILTFISSLIYTVQHKKHEIIFDSFGDNVTRQTAISLEMWLEEQTSLVKSLAINPRIIDVCLDPNSENTKEAKTFLEDIQTDSEFYQYINLSVDFKSGSKVLKLGETYIDSVNGYFVGQSPIYGMTLEEFIEGKELIISDVFSSKLWNEDVFEYIIPIMYEDKQVGILCMGLKVDYYTNNYQKNNKLGNTGEIALLSYSGAIIAHKNKEELKKKFADNPELLEYLEGTIGSYIKRDETNFDGEFFGIKKRYSGKTISHEYFNNHKWYIIFSQAKAEIYSSERPLRIILIIMSITVLTIGTGIIWLTLKNEKDRTVYKELELANQSLESKVKEREKELMKLMTTDSMTQIYNHKYLFELIQNKMESEEENVKLSIVMIDLDHFKRINDNYGHQFGDEVLITIVENIKKVLLENETFGRYGGEEFLIIYDIDCEEEVLKKAELIRKIVENSKYISEDIVVTASIGISIWNGQTINEFIKAADDAVYKAKENGRNVVVQI